MIFARASWACRNACTTARRLMALLSSGSRESAVTAGSGRNSSLICASKMASFTPIELGSGCCNFYWRLQFLFWWRKNYIFMTCLAAEREGTAIQPVFFPAFLILSRCFCSEQKLGHLQNQNYESLGALQEPWTLPFVACDKANDKEVGMSHCEPFCDTCHIF